MARILHFAHSLAERLYQEGVDLEEAGEPDAAMAAFERAVQVEGAHANARLALAYHCRRLERLDEAVAHCQAVLAAEPRADAFFLLGLMRVAQQDFPAALDALHRCLELDPAYDPARYQIAFVYYLRAEYEVAITEFHRAAQREPEWETLFFLGECYRMTRRPAEAERTFRRALGLTTNWGQVELTRGQIRACQRLAEFPREATLSIKERLYADCGIVVLGAQGDDGLAIPPYLFYHFDFAAVAVTLRRFLALAAAQGWGWDTVVPVSIVDLPLALVLARLFGVSTEPRRGAQTLVVQALGETMEGLQDAAEGQDNARTFCLLACWPEEWRPDILGVATPLVGTLPWYRPGSLGRLHADLLGRAASPRADQRWLDPRPPEAIAADLLAALAATPEEPSLAAHLAFYARHARLRWV